MLRWFRHDSFPEVLRLMLNRDPIDVTDDLFITIWVQMIQDQITA
jgi:hypothetical protein